LENHANAHWYLQDPDPTAPRSNGGYDQLTESALYFDIAFAERPDEGGVVALPVFPR
jgi:hypothetical protein